MSEFRGVFHIHSTFSDGSMSLAEIRDWAVSRHLDFVCVTDHSESLTQTGRDKLYVECERLSGEILLLPGLEFAYSGRHVIAFAPRKCLTRIRAKTVVTDPSAVRDCGGLTVWAHPALTYSLTLHNGIAADYDGWEVWNVKNDGAFPNLRVLSLFERTAEERNLTAFAGWDLHTVGAYIDGPSLTVTVPESKLTTCSLLHALRKGCFDIERGAVKYTNASLTASRTGLQWFRSCIRYWRTRFLCASKYLAHRVLQMCRRA